MSDQNLFEEDWINCLRAHYTHVIRERDDNNEQSLITVLLQTGFLEDDIAAMRTEAMTGMDWQEEQPEQEVAVADAESYDWVIEREPVIAVADEASYAWVVEPELPAAEAVVEPPLDRLDVEPAVDAELPLDSDDDEPPPASFVQMSMF